MNSDYATTSCISDLAPLIERNDSGDFFVKHSMVCTEPTTYTIEFSLINQLSKKITARKETIITKQ